MNRGRVLAELPRPLAIVTTTRVHPPGRMTLAPSRRGGCRLDRTIHNIRTIHGSAETSSGLAHRRRHRSRGTETRRASTGPSTIARQHVPQLITQVPATRAVEFPGLSNRGRVQPCTAAVARPRTVSPTVRVRRGAAIRWAERSPSSAARRAPSARDGRTEGTPGVLKKAGLSGTPAVVDTRPRGGENAQLPPARV